MTCSCESCLCLSSIQPEVRVPHPGTGLQCRPSAQAVEMALGVGGQGQQGWEEAGMTQTALASLRRAASSSGGRAGRSE